MIRRVSWARGTLLLAATACVLLSTGCTYLQYRAEDALDMADIGITVSYKPGLAVWFAAPFSLIAAFGGHVDGYLIGVGGGHPVFTRHYLDAMGLVVFGYEELGWGDFDKDDPATLYRTYQGVLGIPLSLGMARPAYTPTCNHEIHLLFLGVVANLKYMEIADFLLGFTTLDLAGDDGAGQLGHWPWGFVAGAEDGDEDEGDASGRLGHWPWRSEEGMDEQSRDSTLWPW